MVILNSMQGVLSVFLMIAIGYILSMKKWIGEKEAALFSKIVVKISLPAFMVYNLLTSYDRERLAGAGMGLVIPICSMIITYIISIPLGKLIKVRPERRGTFRAMFSLSNTIFIGVPINLALFGEKSIADVLLYYIANTIFFWTIGIYCIRNDAGETSKLFSVESLKKIVSPTLIAFIFSIILILLNISLPGFIMDCCKYMGNLTTPLSMLFIGSTVYSINIRNIKPDKDVIFVLIGRFIISPLTIAAILFFFPLPVLMKKVFIIQASLPVISQAAIVTKAYNADYEYATTTVVLSTLISLICIPIYITIFSYVF